MNMISLVTLAFGILGAIVWAWIRGIDHMQKIHPDYRGEDLFDES
jgi:hypothetical protein